MKAIVLYTQQEYNQQMAKYHELQDKISDVRFTDILKYNRSTGYAHYMFRGNYTDTLVALLGRHPMPDEIIMLVDGGFYHFGASCTVDTSRQEFYGKVHTD